MESGSGQKHSRIAPQEEGEGGRRKREGGKEEEARERKKEVGRTGKDALDDNEGCFASNLA